MAEHATRLSAPRRRFNISPQSYVTCHVERDDNDQHYMVETYVRTHRVAIAPEEVPNACERLHIPLGQPLLSYFFEPPHTSDALMAKRDRDMMAVYGPSEPYTDFEPLEDAEHVEPAVTVMPSQSNRWLGSPSRSPLPPVHRSPPRKRPSRHQAAPVEQRGPFGTQLRPHTPNQRRSVGTPPDVAPALPPGDDDDEISLPTLSQLVRRRN